MQHGLGSARLGLWACFLPPFRRQGFGIRTQVVGDKVDSNTEDIYFCLPRTSFSFSLIHHDALELESLDEGGAEGKTLAVGVGLAA